MNNNYLAHHGVKGQKWGVRRYQNEDGSFTPEGLKRYGVDSNGKMSREGSKLWRQDRRAALKDANADLKGMALKTNNLFRSYETNQSRYSAGKLFISEKYGKTTLKDYQRNERLKTFAAYGSAFLASIAVMLGSTYITLKKVSSDID